MTEGSAEAVCELMLTKGVCVNIGMGGIVMCFAAAYLSNFKKRLTWNQLKELHDIVKNSAWRHNFHRSGHSLHDFEMGGSLHDAFDKWLAQNTYYLAFCAALEAPATFDFIREGFVIESEKFGEYTMKFFEFCHWLLMQLIRDAYADDPDCGFLLESKVEFKEPLDQDDMRFMSETLLHRISTMNYHLGQQFWGEVHPYAIWSAIETLAPIMAVLTGSSAAVLLDAAREGKGDLVSNVRSLLTANLSQAGVLLEPKCFNATIVQGMVNCVETTLYIEGGDHGACLLVWALLTARSHHLKKNLLNDINHNGGKKFKDLLTGIIAESTGDLLSARNAIFERCQRPYAIKDKPESFSYTRGEAWIIRWKEVELAAPTVTIAAPAGSRGGG